MHNVDVMTDISAPVTAFTRYTVAPTTASRTSRYASFILVMMALISTQFFFLAHESDELQGLNEKWRERSDQGEKGLLTRKNTFLDLSRNWSIGF